MKKGRFCRSWIFSPKCHSKVGPVWCSGDLLCPTVSCLRPLALHGQNQKFFVSVKKMFSSVITRKAHVRGDCSPKALCSVPTCATQVGASCTVTTIIAPFGAPGREGRCVWMKLLSQPVLFAALELDKNRVLETAPLGFRALLGVLGIEAALESLITSLCVGENH